MACGKIGRQKGEGTEKRKKKEGYQWKKNASGFQILNVGTTLFTLVICVINKYLIVLFNCYKLSLRALIIHHLGNFVFID